MAWSEYKCKCGSSNISIVSIRKAVHQLGYDKDGQRETEGECIEDYRLGVMHYECRDCDFTTTNLSDFDLVHYSD